MKTLMDKKLFAHEQREPLKQGAKGPFQTEKQLHKGLETWREEQMNKK